MAVEGANLFENTTGLLSVSYLYDIQSEGRSARSGEPGRRFRLRRFVSFARRAARIDAADRTLERFISTYVFDLLSDDDTRAVVNEARRVLKLDGLLGLVGLTEGPKPLSRMVTTAWCGLHRISPWLVGGCTPITLRGFLPNAEWSIEYRAIIVRFGVPSEVVVARPLLRVPN